MKHTMVSVASLAAVSHALVGLSPFARTDASLAGALPARGDDGSFTERVISTIAEGALSVFATDLDGDGDIDVLSASTGSFPVFDDKIAWYESDGGSPPAFTERAISTTAEVARSVFAVDVDGDGDTDVLSASAVDDKIAWYESDGGSPPTSPSGGSQPPPTLLVPCSQWTWTATETPTCFPRHVVAAIWCGTKAHCGAGTGW